MDEIKAEAVPSAQGDGVPTKGENTSPEPVKSSEAQQQTSVSATLQNLTDKALHFLSHASNETLGACLVGLSATTYMVLGRVGLVIIGVAGGVVLHATWEGIRNDDRDDTEKRVEQERRKEAGVELAKRVLDWRNSTPADDDRQDVKVYANQQLDFSSFDPETETALNTFTDAIIKDYVHYWYDPTVPGEESFPATCKQTLTAFLLSLSGHLRRKRPADAFLDFVTNASSIIIVFLNELSAAMNASPNASAEDAIATYLALKPDSSLSYMLNQDSQNAKLTDAAEDILQAYLDPKAYNFPPVHAFLKEVLAQLVLGYTVSYCSKADFINDWIVYGLEESQTTKEVMDIVDAGVEGRKSEGAVKQANTPAEKAEVVERMEATPETVDPERPVVAEHKRQASRAEEAMDEAMQEARRLTQLMIEEDERRAREEQEKQAAASSSEDVSDAATQDVDTPTSSESEKERHDEEKTAWKEEPRLADGTLLAGSPPMTPTTKQQFTSFDQILPAQQPTALTDSPERARTEAAQLTLHNATMSIFDDSVPGERTSIKAKPTTDYLIQIEPASSAFPGWMIARKYADFEMLHEVLRRISVITGVHGFAQTHNELPKWKTNTKASLRAELERYLTDAVRFQPLAESEGMKRFLEKEQGLTKSPSERKQGFGWPTPDAFGKFGGDMVNVLAKAPKQVAGGGKAVFGGVAGLVGGKRPNQPQSGLSRTSTNSTLDSPMHRSTASLGQPFATDSYLGSMSAPRQSHESVRSVPKPSLDRQNSAAMTASGELKPRPSVSSSRYSSEMARADEPAADSSEPSPMASQTQIPGLDGGMQGHFTLPPPPSEITDDFGSPQHAGKKAADSITVARPNERMSVDEAAAPAMPPRPAKPAAASKSIAKPKEPITERETSVAIELMFAVITELYTLSSAWQIRRTLLAAAKNFLLRPGNPQLITIRDMLQESMLDNHLSDSGVAAQIYKLRENSLPTAEEMEIWKRDYPEKTEEQKEDVKLKARTLLVTKGMPQALTSVMGAAASAQALGKVFDCLQVPEVARGLVFGLMLQALKIITH